MKNKVTQIILAIIAGFVTFLGLGWSFFESIVHVGSGNNMPNKPHKKKKFEFRHTKINHPRYKFEKEYEDGKAWCKEQKLKDCFITSVDGLVLHAYYLPAINAKRFVILCHGYKGSGFGDFANTARFLHENNCNLLFIDQRCCGMSEGEYITFGAKEQHDIKRWVYYIAHRNQKHLPIYLYGESMGAASVLMASGGRLPSDVKGLIADCGFSSMRNQLNNMAENWFHIKWNGLMLLRLDIFCTMFAGFRMKQASTTKALFKNELPILFFHGEKDTYVDVKNSIYNYDICQAPKELVIISEARHLCSPYENPRLYRKKLLQFFEKYDYASA